MCGLAGYYNITNTPIKTNIEIVDMLEVQRHRGPDDSGIVFFNLNTKSRKEVDHKKNVKLDNYFEGVLGFNRLSILDLSYHGHQPMMNEEGDVILTLNGEIYNAFDFKEELLNDGVKFKSTSDTEVVLYLYLKYGIDKMLTLLNGMFAIVIVDLRLSEVYIARDRFGIKPMYYFHNEKQIGFSSELKSFYKINGFKATLNKELLDEFLIFRNTRSQTLINEVEILPPGYLLSFNKHGKIKLKQFFDINEYQRNNVLGNDVKSLLKNVNNTLQKSVNSQLISDVKLGCQLSGGVDSSIITYLANNISKNKNFESVSIILDNPNYSEEKYIDKVSNQIEIKAHKFKMDVDYYFNHLRKATWHLEGPLNHPNTIGIYLLSQRAKEFVTVLLSGEGADEVFGGYSRFHKMKFRYSLPFFKGLIKSFPKPIAYLKEYLNIPLQAIMGITFMPFEMAKKLKPDFDLNKAIQPRLDLYNKLEGSVFDKQVKYEMETYIPDLLIRQDKMSMAHSIENRVPFLDNKVVEKSFEYPEDVMIRKNKNHEKYLLKELASNFFGKDFAYRDKMGFGIPLRDFFRDEKFKLYLTNELLPSMIKRELFDKKQLNQLFTKINKLNHKEMDSLWIILTLEIWLQEFIDVNSMLN
jgi:asparagine synthase (glutamine-hydrolysing)